MWFFWGARGQGDYLDGVGVERLDPVRVLFGRVLLVRLSLRVSLFVFAWMGRRRAGVLSLGRLGDLFVIDDADLTKIFIHVDYVVVDFRVLNVSGKTKLLASVVLQNVVPNRRVEIKTVRHETAYYAAETVVVTIIVLNRHVSVEPAAVQPSGVMVAGLVVRSIRFTELIGHVIAGPREYGVAVAVATVVDERAMFD